MMLITTDRVSRSGRLEFWQRQVGSLLTHLECSSDAIDDFEGSMAVHLSQPTNLIKINAATHAIARARPSLAQSADEQVFICLQIEGEASVEQDGRQGVLRPGDITLLDTSRAFHAEFPERMSQLVLQLPKALVRKQIGSVERLTARIVAGSDPVASITHDFVRSLARNHGRLSSAVSQRLTEQAAEMAMMAFASLMDDSHRLADGHSPAKYLLANRARTYIDANLRQASLGPADVAAHLGISRRYLSRIFAADGQSVERYIWAKRLARCARDLKDQGQAGRTIGDIAFSWGFNNLAHFSQSFRNEFGQTPTQYRKGA